MDNQAMTGLDEHRIAEMLDDAELLEEQGKDVTAANYRRAAEAYRNPETRPLVCRAWMDIFYRYDRYYKPNKKESQP